MMTSVTLRLALAATLALGAAPAVFAEPTKPARLDDTPSFKSGEDAWNKVCSRCHTVDGTAHEFSVGPDLSKTPYDRDTLAFFVRNGYLAMPSFPEATLDNATLTDLADYMAKHVYKEE